MNAHIDVQLIKDAVENPAFVVVPYEQRVKQTVLTAGMVPNEVTGAVIKGGKTPVRAWREYLGLTQEVLPPQRCNEGRVPIGLPLSCAPRKREIKPGRLH